MKTGINTWSQSKKSALERWEEKIARPDGPDGCWIWTRGNGRMAFKGSGVGEAAHLWGYRHFVGDIPEGLLCTKACDTDRCVNPAHRLLVDSKEAKSNVVRERWRKTKENRDAFSRPTSTCIHHWIIAAPNGPESPGTCRKCGASSSFPNWQAEFTVRAPRGAA